MSVPRHMELTVAIKRKECQVYYGRQSQQEKWSRSTNKGNGTNSYMHFKDRLRMERKKKKRRKHQKE